MRLTFQSVLALFLFGALIAVFLLPYRAWDALSYGEWSRLIAQSGRYHFPTVTELMYQRPLFYVGQGWLWRLLGYHDAIGRAFGLSFGFLLAISVWRLARELSPARLQLSSYACLALLFAIPGVAEHACSGLADVPVAALVACAGATLWILPAGAKSTFLLVVLSCLAVLAKPSAAPALAGLGLAHAVGPKRDFGGRLVFGCLPLCAGMGLAVMYDVVEAHRTHMRLSTFLTGALTGYYDKMSAGARWGAFWDWSWLGPGLRFPLLLALLFAVLRILGVDHRRALRVSVWAALFLAWFGPWLAAGRVSLRVGLFAPGRLNLLFLLAAALLAGACLLDHGELALSRVNLGRLLVWGIPGYMSWLLYVSYDARLLSAVWAPAVLLIGCVVTPPLIGALRDRPWLGILGFAAVMVLSVTNLPRLDGLDPENWRAVGSSVAHGRFRPDDLRRSLSPDFQELLEILRKIVLPDARIFSPEGRLRFFFPGRVAQAYPHNCEELTQYQYFVLIKGAWMENYFLTEVGVPGTVAYWSDCKRPSLRLVTQTDHYAVFSVVNGS